MKTEVLGIKIDDLTLSQAVDTVKTWLQESKKRYIVTPNPEFCVIAQTDQKFKNILNSADLAIPDGSSLKLSGKIKNVVTGTDLMEQLTKICADQGFTIGLLGGKEKLAARLKERLIQAHPTLKVNFCSSGGTIDTDGESVQSASNLEIPKLDILFVAFGQVKQEKWIAKNMDSLNVKVFMGVGGAFDYLSGNVQRAPKVLRSLGLEWLFRLLTQPWRLKRQLALLRYLWLLTKT